MPEVVIIAAGFKGIMSLTPEAKESLLPSRAPS
jgi:hypothetical protein